MGQRKVPSSSLEAVEILASVLTVGNVSFVLFPYMVAVYLSDSSLFKRMQKPLSHLILMR